MIDSKRVQRVNLGSLNNWKKYDIRPNDLISLTLAGQGIPHLERVAWQAEERKDIINIPEPKRYHHLSCLWLTPECELQFLARLRWLSGKQGLNLKGIDSGTWQKLLTANKLTSLTSWLDLSESDLTQMEGIGTTRARQIYQQFQLAKEKPLAQWLYALGFTYRQPQWLYQQNLMELKHQYWKTLLSNKQSHKQAIIFLHNEEINKLIYQLINKFGIKI